MNICEDCIYFRQVRPSSQLLAAAVDTRDAAVSAALGKIVEDEQKLREAEADRKRAQAETEQATWPRRPVMSSYCAFAEAQGRYLIAEIKNVGGSCDDFEKGRPERRACSDCQHRVAASGPDRDRQRENVFMQMHAEATSVKSSTSSPEGLLKAHREGVPARKAFEVSGAYSSDGRLAAKPEYLDHCGRFSTEGDYAVCALVNPHNTCRAWEHQAAADLDRGDRPSSSEAGTTSRWRRKAARAGRAPSAADRLNEIRASQEQKARELEEADPMLAEAVRAHNRLTSTSLAAQLADIEAQATEHVINHFR